MTTKIKGTEGIEFPDATVQATAADNGPAFRAGPQTATNLPPATDTKVILDYEEFDTDNCFANSRFTPNVAGYYQISYRVAVTDGSTSNYGMIYKNGTAVSVAAPVGPVDGTNGSDLIYLNGTTDYVELWAHSVGGADTTGPTFVTFMAGFLARKA